MTFDAFKTRALAWIDTHPRTLAVIAVLALLMASCQSAQAQTTQPVPVTVTLRYTIATTGSDGSPLLNPITRVRIWAKTAPITDASPGTPTFELGAVNSHTFTMQAVPGSTVYFRVANGTATTWSGMTPQAQRIVPSIQIPSVPGGVSVTVTISQTEPTP